MESITPIVVGALAVVAGCLIKILMDWEEMRPGAPIDTRGRALFRQMYLAPDLAMLSVGLLISFNGLQRLLAAKGIASPLGERLLDYYSILMWGYVVVLILSIVLWLAAGNEKYIPIEKKMCTVIDIDGQEKKQSIDSPNWTKGWFSKEGLLTLVTGNLLGFLCISSYIFFVVKAF